MNILTEEQFQAECAQWFHNYHPSHRKMLFTVDNNVSKRVLNPYQRMIEGNRKKAMGVEAGVSDFIFISYRATHFIELKMSNGVQGEEQKIFQQMVEARGHKYFIVKCLTVGSLDQLINFKNLIEWIIKQE